MARPSLSSHNAPEALFEDFSICEGRQAIKLIAAVEVAPIPSTPVVPVFEIVSTNVCPRKAFRVRSTLLTTWSTMS
jgi:hypothetical protein